MKLPHILFWSILLMLAQPLQADQALLRFHQYTADDGLAQNTVMAIAQDRYGFMWFGTWEGLSRFDGYEFKVFRAIVDDPTSITNNRINAIITDAAGDLWVETGDSRYLFRYNYEGEHFERFAPGDVAYDIRRLLSNYRPNNMKVSNDTFSWEITGQGLRQTQIATQTIIDFAAHPIFPFALRDDVLHTLYLDKNENLWVGTQNAGVQMAGLHTRQFQYRTIGHPLLSGNVVRAIHQDTTGKIWVGSETEGITVFDARQPSAKLRQFGTESLINTEVRSIFTDYEGYVWIGTKGGITRYHPATNRFKHYHPGKPGSIPHPWVFYITEDSNNVIWVGTFGGLSRYDRTNDHFINYTNAPFLNSNRVRYILEDNERRLWVATEGAGISCLQPTTGNGDFKATHYRNIEGDSLSLINDLVLSLQQDELGFIWAGTNGGLCRLDPSSGQFTRFSVAKGFPDDLIMGMLADGNGHLWVSHKKGITRVDIKSFETRTFSRFDGLQGNEFSQNACYRNPANGELHFGGLNGLNSFFPNSIQTPKSAPRPVLTTLKIMNQIVQPGVSFRGRIILEQSLLSTSKISIKQDEAHFSIAFSALNFSNPKGSQYKYRMHGADAEWIYTDASKREATYTHLASGNYKFELYASYSDGVWSSEPVVLHVSVIPPWWMSSWAKLFYLLLIILVGWMVYRYLTARIDFRNKLMLEQIKNEKNEELMNMKIQFFTEISHEFRTPLTLIIEPLERLMEDETDEEDRQYYFRLMKRNAKQLLELINQLLDFRKLQSGKLQLQPVNDNLIAFVRNVAGAFDNKAREKQIRFAVLSNVELLEVHFDPDKLRKILNNLISNAFRFTPKLGEIIVRVFPSEARPGFIEFEVEDNGPGIATGEQHKIFEAFYQASSHPHNHQGTGLGLALTKELVELHGGTITVETAASGGSRFRFTIPATQPAHLTTISEEVQQDEHVVYSDDNDDFPANFDQQHLSLLLVVDDNADIRKYIAQQFRTRYRVITAADGLEGYRIACEQIPDLVVSDVMMPGIDGYELCRRLKTNEQTSQIPVILLTARTNDEARVEGYEMGADAYITKPFNKKVLESRVDNLLEQRHKWKQVVYEGVPEHDQKTTIRSTEEAFLRKVVALVEEHLEDTEFEAAQLANLMHVSRTQLYRKMKTLTNRSVHDIITTIRMQKARQLLLAAEDSISEVAYKVGYSLPTNFTRTFSKYYGMSPKKYIDQFKK